MDWSTVAWLVGFTVLTLNLLISLWLVVTYRREVREYAALADFVADRPSAQEGFDRGAVTRDEARGWPFR